MADRKTPVGILDSEKVIQFYEELAVAIGDRHALLVQKIYRWMKVFQDADRRDHFFDDHWWVYNTWTEWQENLPFWDTRTIRRLFDDLERVGILVTRPHADRNSGKWVTINFGMLEQALLQKEVRSKIRELRRGSGQNVQTGGGQNVQGGLDKMSRRSGQNVQPTGDTIDNNSYTNTDERSSSVAAATPPARDGSPAPEPPSNPDTLSSPPEPHAQRKPVPSASSSKLIRGSSDEQDTLNIKNRTALDSKFAGFYTRGGYLTKTQSKQLSMQQNRYESSADFKTYVDEVFDANKRDGKPIIKKKDLITRIADENLWQTWKKQRCPDETTTDIAEAFPNGMPNLAQ